MPAAMIETNVDDLTDDGVWGFLMQMLGPDHVPVGTQEEWDRSLLSQITGLLDRASPDWPQRVLGLPAVA